jgi:transposase
MTSASQTSPEILVLKKELEASHAQIEVLKKQLEWCLGQLYGAGKSETLDRLQTMLPLDVPAYPVVQATQTVSYERKVVAKEKRPLTAEAFKDVPVKETVVIEPEEVKVQREAYEQIGEERTFEIDIVPPQLFKRVIVRPKYRHKTDRSVAPVVAAAPERPVMGGYASAGLLSWVCLSKYVDHAPLYRLEQQSARWGAQISRQTMADWIGISAEWLEPIYKRMHKRLLDGNYLQVDETPIRVNDPDEKRGGTTEGWMWVVSRPGDDVVFDWRLSRRHGELTSLIEGFKGLLQSDGYAAYESYANNHPEVTWLVCWAHCRRKFFAAQKESPRVVHFVLRIIGWLYQAEKKWDEHKLSDTERERHRKRYFPRRLYWLKKVVLAVRERVLPKSGLCKACDYMLRFWPQLTEHLNHGVTKLDTNLVENAIRPSAIGKKNFLFIGHPDAGQRSAIIYSLVVSCQRHGINPMDYLRDVLTRLPRMTTSDDLDCLTPSRWKPAQ